jgi:hypothetical protein
MKLLSFFTNLRTENSLKANQTQARPISTKKAQAVPQRALPIWPMAPMRKADWLKLYQAMDTAG